ncbi:integral membrane sensor signal transduction histidine kinase [Haloterrigena turkmenica DSM 5511]|uniref:histidine kinase n=1 Tax=Haloterrigena turkmenica (strain ATCC 51198 / DSM 5511 / JCM 9101 / NCIMB 13204 / VKM B-1734 / 4k) TaxID=543526 RepID=D2RU15_HALTV|nr:HAMP domain-containing sensor histidine kinase [Haloterrigena turkmenica]ADB59084.1 integral membrane sensor signal transduction histidine kinase [Haloterrigena turkmenica DSM 5511]
MRWPADTDIGSPERIPRYVVGFGVTLTLVLIGEIALYRVFVPTFVFRGVFLVGVITTIPFLVGIAFGGRWLRTSDLSPARYPRVVGWLLGGLVGFLFVNLALIVTMPTESWVQAVSWIRWAIALGAGIGLLVGCLEGRAIERTLAAERASLRAEHVEEQREYLDYLNGILRHEVLNTATIINGYASLLYEEAATTDQQRRWAEIVIAESEEMSTVIDDVRILLQSADGELQLEAIDLSRLLTDEVRKLEHKCGPVEVETSIPPDVSVRADDLVARVFGNLLSNAVEHNDASTPRVSVAVDPGPETVRVEIADNGPGIPDSTLETIFERTESHGSSHGIGLYLVRQLVSRYDGAVEVAETGPDGTTFAVELPAASESQSTASSSAHSTEAP